MAIAKLAELELYYATQGSGEPVLLAPASWWPSATWNVGVVPFLSQRFKTIAFDCRGTGKSSQPQDGYTVAQFAQDCLGLLAHLGVARCHAVGFALGGQIMQAMAIERRSGGNADARGIGGWHKDACGRTTEFVAGYRKGNSGDRL